MALTRGLCTYLYILFRPHAMTKAKATPAAREAPTAPRVALRPKLGLATRSCIYTIMYVSVDAQKETYEDRHSL